MVFFLEGEGERENSWTPHFVRSTIKREKAAGGRGRGIYTGRVWTIAVRMLAEAPPSALSNNLVAIVHTQCLGINYLTSGLGL